MKVKIEKRVSLYWEWIFILFIAGMVSLLFFMGSKFIVEQQIEKCYQNRNLVQKYNEKYILQFQEYVTEQNISSNDIQKLDEWINDNKLIYIQINKNNKWIYSSDFSIEEREMEDYDFFPYSSNHYYDIKFYDGTAKVFITGMYSYHTYMIALVFDMILSFLLFLLLTMLGIRKKIAYINQLSKDIKILEGGNLEYIVHIQGNDEITDLAIGLNAMKNSFKNQIEEIECLTKTNQCMVTEISHDLRTPLTSVLLYAEILKSGKCKNEQQIQSYLDKIVKKIQHMKYLLDRLLSYSTSEKKYIAAEYMPFLTIYDELSDMCYYLEKQGFQIDTDIKWKKGKILMYEEYLIRILDNISSNILKYADKNKTISMRNEYHTNEMSILFENPYINSNNNTDGYHIGIQNIKMMMNEMNGKCEVIQNEQVFCVCITFQYKEQ